MWFSCKKSAQKSYILMYLWVHKNQAKLIKKCDISPRKFKKRGTLKMVSKRLKDHYWREERGAKASSKSVLHLDYSQNFQKGPRCTIFEPAIFESEYKKNSYFFGSICTIFYRTLFEPTIFESEYLNPNISTPTFLFPIFV